MFPPGGAQRKIGVPDGEARPYTASTILHLPAFQVDIGVAETYSAHQLGGTCQTWLGNVGDLPGSLCAGFSYFIGSVGGGVAAPVQVVVVGGQHPAFGDHAEAGAEVHGQILCTAVVSFIEVLAGR
mgnify:CR=1 FL=1